MAEKLNAYYYKAILKSYNYSGGQWVPNPYEGRDGSQSWYDQGVLRVGFRNPDYRKQIRDNQQAGTPYNVTAWKVENIRHATGNLTLAYTNKATGISYSYIQLRFEGVWLTPDKFYPPAWTFPVFSSNVAEAAALTKLYSKIRGEYQRFNASASVAEFGDVIRQFGKPFDAIIDLTNRRLNRLALESRGLKGSVAFRKIKFAEIVASTYLEYAFGLAPLIDDTKKAAEALARFNSEKINDFPDPRRKVSATGKEEIVTSSAANEQFSGSQGLLNLLHTQKMSSELSVRYTVGLDASFLAAYGSNDRLLQLMGFQPRDFIPAVWEVVPWSWLIDYVTNVGDILNAAATTLQGVKWIVRSERKRSTTNHRWTLNVPETLARAQYIVGDVNQPIVNWDQTEYGSYDIVNLVLSRTLPNQLGIPPLIFELPFKDLKKVANLASVLISRKPSASRLWLT